MNTRRLSKTACFSIILGLLGATAVAQRLETSSQPHTFGPTAVSYVRVPASAFFPNDSSCAYLSTTYAEQRWGSSCSSTPFVAPLHLPSGAKVVSLDWAFNDINATFSLLASVVVCDPLGNGFCVNHPANGAGPLDCISPGYVCSGNAFAGGISSQSADLTPDNITVDNVNNQYLLYALMNVSDGSNRTGGMLVGYKLQVSPAPVTATFTDVPTSHPYFQFIEALFAAGVTAGCTQVPPQYCPDRQITRGEMAVYLAKALGLQFP